MLRIINYSSQNLIVTIRKNIPKRTENFFVRLLDFIKAFVAWTIFTFLGRDIEAEVALGKERLIYNVSFDLLSSL